MASEVARQLRLLLESQAPAEEDLYTLVRNHGGLRIREVWSIDAPNHGDAAVLNEKDLQWGYEPICTLFF